MKKVFLGGTCNGSLWRAEFEKKLKIDFYNPVVENWTEEDYKRELKEREECDFCVYVITPKMTGVYSIAEVIDDSNKRPQKTIFCYVDKDGDDTFSSAQLKSLSAVGKMVEKNGAKRFGNVDETIAFLNQQK